MLLLCSDLKLKSLEHENTLFIVLLIICIIIIIIDFLTGRLLPVWFFKQSHGIRSRAGRKLAQASLGGVTEELSYICEVHRDLCGICNVSEQNWQLDGTRLSPLGNCLCCAWCSHFIP